MPMWAVITNDRTKAEKAMSQIETKIDSEVVQRVNGSYRMEVRFTNGCILRWVKPTESARGLKLDRMWIDESLRTTEIIRDVFFHSMIHCNKENIHWI